MIRERYEQHSSGVFKKLKYLNLCKPLPYGDGSVDVIFSSHVFDVLFLDEVEKLIRECHRVLKPGGICRIVVGDLDKKIKLYEAGDLKNFIISMYTNTKRMSLKNLHHCAFTGPFLTKLFAEAGFHDCRVLSYRVGNCPDIDRLDNRPDESIYFEAIK